MIEMGNCKRYYFGALASCALIFAMAFGICAAQESRPAIEYSITGSVAEVLANPASAEAHYRLGYAYFKDNNLKDAESEFKKAISLNPEYAEAYNGLGWVYQTPNRFFVCANMEVKPDARQIVKQLTKYLQAEENHSQAIHLMPDYADAYRGLGWAYFRMNHYAKATDAFSEAIRLYPYPESIRLDLDYDRVYFMMGIAYRELKWFQEAIVAYEKVVERNLDFDKCSDEENRFWKRSMLEESFSIIASVYTESGRHLEAVTTYKRMLSVFPNDWGANYGLCLAYKALGDMKSAKAAYELLVKQVETMESERLKAAFDEQLNQLRERLNK